MAIELVTTVGASSANSYVSVDDALTYFEGVPFSDAIRDAGDDLATYLFHAAKLMQDFQWLGERVNETQALAWPRVDCPNPDSIGSHWGRKYEFLSTIIPQRVKDAQCELAKEILAGGEHGPLMGGSSANVTSFKLGDLSVTTDDAGNRRELVAVKRLLRGMIVEGVVNSR